MRKDDQVLSLSNLRGWNQQALQFQFKSNPAYRLRQRLPVPALPPAAAKEPPPRQCEFVEAIDVGQINKGLQLKVNGNEDERQARRDRDSIALLRAQALCKGGSGIQTCVHGGKEARWSPAASKPPGPFAGKKVSFVGVFCPDCSKGRTFKG